LRSISSIRQCTRRSNAAWEHTQLPSRTTETHSRTGIQYPGQSVVAQTALVPGRAYLLTDENPERVQHAWKLLPHGARSEILGTIRCLSWQPWNRQGWMFVQLQRATNRSRGSEGVSSRQQFVMRQARAAGVFSGRWKQMVSDEYRDYLGRTTLPGVLSFWGGCTFPVSSLQVLHHQSLFFTEPSRALPRCRQVRFPLITSCCPSDTANNIRLYYPSHFKLTWACQGVVYFIKCFNLPTSSSRLTTSIDSRPFSITCHTVRHQ
jgi:hypothetical protein